MISIITVCFNAETYIEQTVKSVLSQSDTEFEFVLVDGASKDGTVHLVQSIVEEMNFPHERFICISENDKGVYDAMNKGVRSSHGDFVLFMNGGDSFYSSNVISTFERIICQCEADAYYGNTMMDFYEGRGILHDNEKFNRNPIMPFIHQSVIVKRKWLIEHPFDITYKVCADFEFFYYMRQHGATFYYEPFIVSNYDAKEGISENNPLQICYDKDRILGIDKQPYYWLRKLWLRSTVGLIQPIKNIAPLWLLNLYFRKKKSYIDWID